MIESLKSLTEIPDLRRRILFTLLLLAVYRLGSYIPTPGINAAVFEQYFNQLAGSLFGLLSMFSGGSLRRLTVFALGIMPYITASIILQLLTVVSPHLEKLSKEGDLGRLHQVVACPDTPQVRGLVRRIHHLVEIVDEPKPAAWLSVPEYTILPQEVVEKPALEAPVPSLEESAAGEARGAKPEPAPEKEKSEDEAAAEPARLKAAAKPAATKDMAKAGKGEEGKKTRKAEASKSHRPVKKTSKK